MKEHLLNRKTRLNTARTMNIPSNPVCWFEIYVQDIPRAKAFYEAVFRATLSPLAAPTPDLEMWTFSMKGCEEERGCSGSICKMKGKDSGGGGTIIYFACEDCAEEEARVVPAGGQVHLPKMSIGEYGFISLVLDPDGNMIGLYSMK